MKFLYVGVYPFGRIHLWIYEPTRFLFSSFVGIPFNDAAEARYDAEHSRVTFMWSILDPLSTKRGPIAQRKLKKKKKKKWGVSTCARSKRTKNWSPCGMRSMEEPKSNEGNGQSFTSRRKKWSACLRNDLFPQVYARSILLLLLQFFFFYPAN